MSGDGTEFTIDIPVTGVKQIDAATSAIDSLAAKLGRVTKATVAQSDAVKAAEASFAKAEQTYDKTVKALERIGLAADAQREKLQLATELGNGKGAADAAARLRILVARQAEYTTKVADSKKALEGEAASLDKIKGAADAATSSGFGVVTIITAIVAGLIAAGVVVGSLIAKTTEWAVGLASANREANLLAQGALRSTKGSEALTAEIDKVVHTLPVARAEVEGTARMLARAGLRGEELNKWLENSSIWASRIKFGPAFEQQMLALDQQSKILQENLRTTFGGLKIEGLLKGLRTMIALLDSSTESGHAIKVVFESLFQPLVDGVAGAAPKVERFFLQLEILALKALIAIKPHASIILLMAEALGIAVGLFTLAAGAVVAFTVALAALPVLIVAGVVESVLLVVGGIRQAIKFFEGLNLRELGTNMVNGLIEGIERAGAGILAALTKAVKAAVDGAKKLLGIASPSKVLADDVGYQMGAGIAVGLDRSAPGIDEALQRATPTSVPGAAPASSGASVTGNTFVFHAVKDAEDAEARFGALLTRMLEGDAAQFAAVPVG